jgi:hypothetical protein
VAAVGDEDEAVREAVVQVTGVEHDGADARAVDVRADAGDAGGRPSSVHVFRIWSVVPVAGFVTVPSSRMVLMFCTGLTKARFVNVPCSDTSAGKPQFPNV